MSAFGDRAARCGGAAARRSALASRTAGRGRRPLRAAAAPRPRAHPARPQLHSTRRSQQFSCSSSIAAAWPCKLATPSGPDWLLFTWSTAARAAVKPRRRIAGRRGQLLGAARRPWCGPARAARRKQPAGTPPPRAAASTRGPPRPCPRTAARARAGRWRRTSRPWPRMFSRTGAS